jgi:hypothetical protein
MEAAFLGGMDQIFKMYYPLVPKTIPNSGNIETDP